MAKPSGIPFQYEIEDRVIKNEWKTVSEQSYLDDVEKKPRPVDIVATREVRSYKSRGTQLALVIEAKHLPENMHVYVRENPYDTKSYRIDGFWSSDLEHERKNFHDLAASHVARHISGTDLYGAVSQSVKALLYLRTKPLLNQAGIFYPVVVYKGGKIIDQDGNEHKNLLYYQSYEWINPETADINSYSLYVDIIHESSLEDYLDNVYKKEFDALMKVINFRARMGENKIERIRQNRWKNSAL